MTDAELDHVDIAVMNLACAVGLPGSEAIDSRGCLDALDRWAEQVAAFTDRMGHRFRDHPAEFAHSDGYFRTLAMITTLQRDLGVKYNPAKIPEDAPFDLADTFVHGVTHGEGGTCATLPVVYAAVAWRLGYPITIVAARGGSGIDHLFARWDDPPDGERFNIEATAPGLACPADDHYRTGRYQPEPDLARLRHTYLASQTPRLALAGFLGQRGHAAADAGLDRVAVEAFAFAAGLAPEDELKLNTLGLYYNGWVRKVKARTPPGFPPVDVQHPRPRVFPDALPLDRQTDLLGTAATEVLLTEPSLAGVWEGLRRGERTGRVPRAVLAAYRPDGACDLGLEF